MCLHVDIKSSFIMQAFFSPFSAPMMLFVSYAHHKSSGAGRESEGNFALFLPHFHHRLFIFFNFYSHSCVWVCVMCVKDEHFSCCEMRWEESCGNIVQKKEEIGRWLEGIIEKFSTSNTHHYSDTSSTHSHHFFFLLNFTTTTQCSRVKMKKFICISIWKFSSYSQNYITWINK
jgi:hypothetical protein